MQTQTRLRAGRRYINTGKETITAAAKKKQQPQKKRTNVAMFFYSWKW
jgi:hypothetical protein